MRLLPFFPAAGTGKRAAGMGKNRDFGEKMWKKRENHGLTTRGYTFMIKDTYQQPGGTVSPYFPWKGGVKRWR